MRLDLMQVVRPQDSKGRTCSKWEGSEGGEGSDSRGSGGVVEGKEGLRWRGNGRAMEEQCAMGSSRLDS